MKKKGKIIVSAVAIVGAALALFAGRDTLFSEKVPTDFKVDLSARKTGEIQAGCSVHDPSIMEKDGTYYIFGSHMTAAKSKDLRTFESLADGYTSTNKVYHDFFNKNLSIFDYAGDNGAKGYSVWAPDVVYNKAQDLYYMYFCTSSTYIKSDLCYATSKNIEGPYDYKGTLLYSGFTKKDIDQTNVCDYVEKETAESTYLLGGQYANKKWPNCIDPTVFYDADGKMWMVYGSWSGGIFLLEIDEKTGEVIHPEADPDNQVDPYFGKRLIGGGHNSIEGPYLSYDETTGYYYLYVSYGELTREGGYQMRCFRSKTVDGEYVDMGGNYPTEGMDHSYFGLKLSGNYNLPSLPKAYMATGHNSVFKDTDGKNYICYHTRFDDGTEVHYPRVHQYLYNEDAWPCMLPYATNKETVSEKGYDMSEVAGKYAMIDQGTSIDSNIAQPQAIYLMKDGTVYGEDIKGTWKMKEDSYYVNFKWDDTEYKGVFCKMKDEAGTDVMTFSAVGKNHSIWGVKYFD